MLSRQQTLLRPHEVLHSDIEATKLADTETQAILDVHCTTTREGSDAEVCAQLDRRYTGELQTLAADKGYDSQWLRETLRDHGNTSLSTGTVR